MPSWKIAGVQTDCVFGDTLRNLEVIRSKLAKAAGNGARLVVLPECILTGYGFESLDEARPHAQPLPGPATHAVADECRRLKEESDRLLAAAQAVMRAHGRE